MATRSALEQTLHRAWNMLDPRPNCTLQQIYETDQPGIIEIKLIGLQNVNLEKLTKNVQILDSTIQQIQLAPANSKPHSIPAPTGQSEPCQHLRLL